MENFYDSIFEYCGAGTYFWRYYGGAIWNGILSLDCFGTIFAGAVHDFLAGTLSLRHSGESLPQIIGRYLGSGTRKVACIFTVLLMILVGAVFVSGPAELLAGMTPDSLDVYFGLLLYSYIIYWQQ